MGKTLLPFVHPHNQTGYPAIPGLSLCKSEIDIGNSWYQYLSHPSYKWFLFSPGFSTAFPHGYWPRRLVCLLSIYCVNLELLYMRTWYLSEGTPSDRGRGIDNRSFYASKVIPEDVIQAEISMTKIALIQYILTGIPMLQFPECEIFKRWQGTWSKCDLISWSPWRSDHSGKLVCCAWTNIILENIQHNRHPYPGLGKTC